MSSIFVSQHELAGLFNVNRTTVRAWTNQGLPYIKCDQGKPHQYHPGIAMWWRKGMRCAELMRLEGLTASQCIALARVYSEDVEGDVGRFVDYLALVNIPEHEACGAFHFAAGLSAGHGAAAKTVENARGKM